MYKTSQHPFARNLIVGLIAVVGYTELALATRQAAGNTKMYFTFFVSAGLIYLVITLFSQRLFGLLPEHCGIRHCHEIAPVRDRIETHGVKIGNNNLVPTRGQRGNSGAQHRAIEADRFGMGIDNQDTHQFLLRRQC